MSAYGAIPAWSSGKVLPPTKWYFSSKESSVTIYHLTLQTARAIPGLIEYLSSVFVTEVETGLTYPQEGPYDQAAFEGYFFAADVFVAILDVKEESAPPSDAISEPSESSLALLDTARGRTWEECVMGYYYIKPNYPGRSSHICNAGFVVPPAQRGRGFGSVLAKSYVHYAPKLAYQASVFNLVYVNNTASIKLWERLGFTKAGRIPRAGRLKRKDGDGEEYLDAWVFYKSFIDTEV
ncbi:acyl-CoA N-acyltransferase [Hymenopellis radicata]|nr:acyl-CoA N-acyltransferase [Hymenopellis radicata]